MIANGNVGSYEDAQACLEATGADAVMSAECLLWNPALFEGPTDASEGAAEPQARAPSLLREYADEVDAHPVPMGCVKSHAFRMLADWLMVFPDLREVLGRRDMGTDDLRALADELERRADERAREEGAAAWCPPLSYRIHPKSSGASKHSHDGREAARAGSGNAARRRLEKLRAAQKKRNGVAPTAERLAELAAGGGAAAAAASEGDSDSGSDSGSDAGAVAIDLDADLDDWDAALREDAESSANLEREFERAQLAEAD